MNTQLVGLDLNQISPDEEHCVDTHDTKTRTNLPTMKSTMLTARKPKAMESQTMSDSGLLKEKTPPCCLSGFLIMMDVPVSM